MQLLLDYPSSYISVYVLILLTDNEVDICGSPNGTIALLRPQSWRHTEPLHSHDEDYHSRQATDRCNHSQTVVADKCRGDGEAVSGVLVEKQPSAMTDTSASSQAPMTRRKRLVGSLEPSSGFFSYYFLAFDALRINEEVVFRPMPCLFEIQFFNHINRSDIPDQFCRAGVNLYIKLRRPCEISCLLTLYVCLFVRCVSVSFPFVHANCGQTVSIVTRLDTMGGCTLARCDFGHSIIGALSLVIQSRYAD